MAKKPASFEYNGTLVKVLDGDTIDAYIDLGFDLKIKKRIRRYHRKLTDHRFNNTKSLKYVKANEYIIKDPETIKSGEVANEPIIIAESEELIKTISVGEALMLMKLNDQNAIFFKNIQTKRLNLLFKRSDGNIGWLDPKK